MVTEDLMKRISVMVMVILLIVSGCSSPVEEGITLTKENYDALMEAKIENDRLKSEVEFLEKRLEDMTGKSPTDSTPTTEVSEGSTSNATETDESAEETQEETDEVVEETSESGFTEDEIAAMVLSLYQDDYGFYGYKNATGDIIIEADFDTATGFSNGIASITAGGKTGTVSRSGVIDWTQVETYETATVKPRNDIEEDSSFGKFIEAYKEALVNEDEAYIKTHTHPNVKISFGGHSGWDGLVDYWSIDEGSNAFYKMMNTTLKYGAVDSSGGQGNAFITP